MTATAPQELSAWLRTTAQARYRQAVSAAAGQTVRTITIPLAGEPVQPGSAEDRTCDRCRSYVPEGTAFYPLHVDFRTPLGVVVMVWGGFCRRCAELEMGDRPLPEPVDS